MERHSVFLEKAFHENITFHLKHQKMFTVNYSSSNWSNNPISSGVLKKAEFGDKIVELYGNENTSEIVEKEKILSEMLQQWRSSNDGLALWLHTPLSKFIHIFRLFRVLD